MGHKITGSILLVLCFTWGSSHQLTVHVNPKTGHDINGDGSSLNPFKSILTAQTAVHSQPHRPDYVDIILHEGMYDLSENPLSISNKDSGISFIGAEGEQRPTLSGGVQLNSESFILDEDTGFLTYDLTQQVTLEQLGYIQSGALGGCANDKAEIFINDEPLYLARYPNVNADTDSWQWNSITAICDESPCLDSFSWSNLNKASEWSQISNVWLHGYWANEWADNHITGEWHTNGSFIVDPSTPPLLYFLAGGRWYAENILNELDTSDEYFIDVDTGMLYLSSDIQDLSNVILTVGSNVVSIQADSSNNVFKGLDFAYSQSTIFYASEVNNVTIDSCVVSNGGGNGISFSSSSDVLVKNTTISSLGCVGMSLGGGDRTTLTHGNLRAVDNTIFDYARWKRTYMPGVSFSGVGIHVLNNNIFNAPHQGINGIGNENLFENNYLHDLCYETSDSGAFYVGRSWSHRGNIIKNNVFENIDHYNQTILGFNKPVSGVYLDDQMSGWEVINNTFINSVQGVLIGGGRHNIVEDNSFINCDIAVALDDRGLTWENTSCPPGADFDQDLQSFNYQEDPWASRYPLVVNTFSDSPCTPIHNSVQNNTYCLEEGDVFGDIYDAASDTNTIANNVQVSCDSYD